MLYIDISITALLKRRALHAGYAFERWSTFVGQGSQPRFGLRNARVYRAEYHCSAVCAACVPSLPLICKASLTCPELRHMHANTSQQALLARHHIHNRLQFAKQQSSRASSIRARAYPTTCSIRARWCIDIK